MKALPDGLGVTRRTPTFTEQTIPSGLLRSHRTKPDVWGRIVVAEGRLRYTILEPSREEYVLSPGAPGIIEPEMSHEVAADGPVRFWVEFLRRPPAD